MIKPHALMALAGVFLSAAASAAPPASCTDANGNTLPPARCTAGAVGGGKEAPAAATVPNFPARKALMLKNLRQAQATLQTVIVCTERATSDAGMRACASK